MVASRRILIVEDEPNTRLVFRTALNSPDRLLTMAEDGETALNWLGKEPADLVLLDLQMPGMDGMNVLRRLRETGNNVPVVIVTAHGSIPEAVQAMKLGAIDFVSKPLTPEALRNVVADVLARHPAKAEGQPASEATKQPAPAPKLSASVSAAEIVTKAKRYLNLRDFNQADELLKKAVALDPKCAEAHYLIGVLHESRDERHAAYGAYRKALHADPNYEPAKHHLMKYFNDKLM